jgi:hypothetical protein
MNAYAYQGALYCAGCTAKTMQNRPQGPLAHGGGAADMPQHCETCGTFLENPLTDDGRDYVQDALDRNDGKPDVLAAWSKFYRMEPCHCARQPLTGPQEPLDE